MRSTRSTRGSRGDFAPGAGVVPGRCPARGRLQRGLEPRPRRRVRATERGGGQWVAVSGRRRGVNGCGGGSGEAGHTPAAGQPRASRQRAAARRGAGADAAAPRHGGPPQAAAPARTPPIAAMNSVVRRVAVPAAPASDFAEPGELECPPPRAPRRDSAAFPPEIGLRRSNPPVRAVGDGRPISRTMGHTPSHTTGPMTGPTMGPIGARTTGRASGRTTSPTGDRTTVRTEDGHPWGSTATPVAAFCAAAGGSGEPPIESHAGRS